ncbi:MAG TPA: type II toxin-antitoxin system VapC family toxin [Opitutales bacterium]|nr:type II toxin-antitoxin system VapC family toxin [Opitutales bacterium]
MILDSSFLVHLERERRRKVQGPASEFLLSHAGSSLSVTPTIMGEIACGDSMRDRKTWAVFVGYFHSLELTAEVSWYYSTVFRHLKNNDQMIEQNDLWIAAAGLAYERPVVTRNISEFARVPHLRVLGF